MKWIIFRITLIERRYEHFDPDASYCDNQQNVFTLLLCWVSETCWISFIFLYSMFFLLTKLVDDFTNFAYKHLFLAVKQVQCNFMLSFLKLL